MLAAELLRRCGVGIICIAFSTPFFGSQAAEEAARDMGLELIPADIASEHLEVLKKPRFGYGKNLNPCIDCHILMARAALEMMEEAGADFLATGEVLGERPKSQNRQALELVSRFSGAGDLLLRPLSARLLDPTLPERRGWVNRDCLMDIEGRSRRRQMDLAEEWGIKTYQGPAGGCLLTDPGFSRRLEELMRTCPGFDVNDAELLKVGRHFWSEDTLIVLGRREAENASLMELAMPSDLLLKEGDRPGPTALVRAYPRGRVPGEETLREAARLLGIYGKGKLPLDPGSVVEVTRQQGGGDEGIQNLD